jgi:hypothetical protein
MHCSEYSIEIIIQLLELPHTVFYFSTPWTLHVICPPSYLLLALLRTDLEGMTLSVENPSLLLSLLRDMHLGVLCLDQPSILESLSEHKAFLKIHRASSVRCVDVCD